MSPVQSASEATTRRAPGAPVIPAQRAKPRERLDPAQRAKLGKALRKQVPLDSHEAFSRLPGQPSPVALLEEQAVSRLPDLVPVRYGRMLASSFSYYRGAALPMAQDLSTTPVTGLTVQACGDAHLSNFGVFGSPERRLLFDLNDFDETLPGPWEWDVKRLAASLEVAARENGFSRKQRAAVVRAAVSGYRRAMREFAGMTNLEVWYAHADVARAREAFESRLTKRQRKRWKAGEAKARTSDSMQSLRKLTEVVDGRRRIIADPPLIVPARDLAAAQEVTLGEWLVPLIAKYRGTLDPNRRHLLGQYELADAARKAVGVGSVGTRCWIVLMFGRDDSDPLFLQVKEAEPSVLSRFVGPSRYSHEGRRVVEGQRLTQTASDIFLGWLSADVPGSGQHDFYVRQLRDWKFSFDIDAMVPGGMQLYGEYCGWTLARAHARSGDRIEIAAYLGGSAAFDHAITEFAQLYADQNEHDHDALREAVASGRITADAGA
jgi:uncharacterized protein (DUF2252 family)